MAGGLCIGADARITAVLTMLKIEEANGKKAWGNPSCEVVRLESTDGGETFSARMVSRPDEAVPHWLPNLERPTGPYPVTQPSLIYTAGTRGESNLQVVSNHVFWSR
jgi:hypothetical protein